MTRLIVALIAGTMVFAAVYAAAASVSVSSNDLAAGDTPVSKCDASGFTSLSFTTNANEEITAITITDIDPACIGGMMTVNIISNGGTPVGNGSAPVIETGGVGDQETVTVTISAAPSTSLVKKVAMLVLGP